MAFTFNSTGAGAGERDSYQRVHVDDGSPAVGAMDHLVHQTVHLSLHCIIHCGIATEGTLYMCARHTITSRKVVESNNFITSFEAGL